MANEQDEALAERISHRYQQMCLRRDGWRGLFSLLSKYVLMRPIWFGDVGVPFRTPRLSVAGVSDDTTLDAASTSATALGGALWPNTSESFELFLKLPTNTVSSDDDVFRTQELKQYEEQATRVTRDSFDAPESQFLIAHAEQLEEQIVFGTSGFYGTENPLEDPQPFYFRSISVENSVIDEGPNGAIDTVYVEHVFTPRQVVEKYGEENVSERTLSLYKAEKSGTEWIKVTQAIEPRPGGKAGEPIDEKPFASVHMEADTKKILKKSGMDENCVMVGRFQKRPNEIYGRSLAMKALASIKELNVLRAANTLMLEKLADPPAGIYHDQIGGSGQINLTAGARVPLYNTGRIPQGQLPVVPLMQIQEPQQVNNRLDKLVEQISVKFLLDKLLDFNNKTRMTAHETDQRVDLRNQSLGNIFARQIIEIYYPAIVWAVRVLWRRKMLGLHPLKDAAKIAEMRNQGLTPLVAPMEVALMMDAGKMPFGVRFISPAARAMKADSLAGLEKLTNFVLTWENGGHMEAGDNVDVDKAIREYSQLAGSPQSVVRGADKVKDLRKQKSQMQAQQAALAQKEQTANIADKASKAAKNYAQAGMPGQTGIPQQQGMMSGG